MKVSTFQKGQKVWYKTKDGTLVPAKVTGVDHAILPVAYSVRLDGADFDRDTESPRLSRRDSGESIPIPSQGSADLKPNNPPQQEFNVAKPQLDLKNQEEDEEDEEDDFESYGDFKAADSPVGIYGQPNSAVQQMSHFAPAQPKIGKKEEPIESRRKLDVVEKKPKSPAKIDWGKFGDYFSGEKAAANSLPGRLMPQAQKPLEIQNPYIKAALQNELPSFEHGEKSPEAAKDGSNTPAGSSDDFGDFEDAPYTSPRKDLQKITVPFPLSHLQQDQNGAAKTSEPFLQNSHNKWEEEKNFQAETALGKLPGNLSPKKQKISDFAPQRVFEIPQQMAHRQIAANPTFHQEEAPQIEEKEILNQEEETEEEIPWYMDPATFLQLKAEALKKSESPNKPSSPKITNPEKKPHSPKHLFQPQLGKSSGSSEKFQSQYSAESPKRSRLDFLPQQSFTQTQPQMTGTSTRGAKPRKQLSREDLASALRLGQFQQNPKQQQQQFQSQRENVSPNLDFLHQLNPQPNAAEAISGPFANTSPYLGAVSFENPHSRVQSASPRQNLELQHARSYPDMWTEMMQTCAEALELGQKILREEQAKKRVENLLASQRGRAYLEALGQIHLAGQLLEGSMKAHVPAQRRPPAFENYFNQCSRAWNSDVGDDPLEDIVLRVSPTVRQASLELPHQAIHAIQKNSQWRSWEDREEFEEPEWQEGLCGITLLPVNELRDLHFAPWLEERPCLILLANLWKNKIQNEPPRLLAGRRY